MIEYKYNIFGNHLIKNITSQKSLIELLQFIRSCILDNEIS